jgi:hypothetical protein
MMSAEVAGTVLAPFRPNRTYTNPRDVTLLCQSCRNRATQANQFNGDPPPLP